MITDWGSVLTFQIFSEVAAVLAIMLKHATTELAQTIGALEGTHATKKTSFKIIPGENRK